jgi:hypothetical protein
MADIHGHAEEAGSPALQDEDKAQGQSLGDMSAKLRRQVPVRKFLLILSFDKLLAGKIGKRT